MDYAKAWTWNPAYTLVHQENGQNDDWVSVLKKNTAYAFPVTET